MIKEKVVQKTLFICDKCGKHITVETELEEYFKKFEKISEYIPNEFHEIEELNLLLCKECFDELKLWAKK